MRRIFLLNRQAGKGSVRQWDKLKAGLAGYECWETVSAGELSERLAGLTEEKITFVAVGGDGTIHQLFQHIHQNPNWSIAMIPAGSGNDFVRSFGAFAPDCPDFKIEQHDYGMIAINGKQEAFLNNTGFGFDAEVAAMAGSSPWKHRLNRLSLGRLVYPLFLVRHLFSYRPGAVTLQADGRDYRFERVWFVTVANQPFYGGGMKIAPAASTRDRQLDCIVVHTLSRWKFLLFFMKVFSGSHIALQEVSVIHGTAFSLRSGTARFAHADGEILGPSDEVSVTLANRRFNHAEQERS